MKNFRLPITLLITTVVLFFLWTATLPAKFKVVERKTYNNNLAELYQQTSDLKAWQEWFPWIDENMAIQTTEEISVGQKLTWKHQEYGQGYIECTRQAKDSLVCHRLQFDKDSEILTSEIRMVKKQTGGNEIIWTLSYPEKYPYPLGRVRAFVLKKRCRQNMKKGLQKLSKSL